MRRIPVEGINDKLPAEVHVTEISLSEKDGEAPLFEIDGQELEGPVAA